MNALRPGPRGTGRTIMLYVARKPLANQTERTGDASSPLILPKGPDRVKAWEALPPDRQAMIGSLEPGDAMRLIVLDDKGEGVKEVYL
jgi:hypothetical protein